VIFNTIPTTFDFCIFLQIFSVPSACLSSVFPNNRTCLCHQWLIQVMELQSMFSPPAITSKAPARGPPMRTFYTLLVPQTEPIQMKMLTITFLTNKILFVVFIGLWWWSWSKLSVFQNDRLELFWGVTSKQSNCLYWGKWAKCEHKAWIIFTLTIIATGTVWTCLLAERGELYQASSKKCSINSFSTFWPFAFVSFKVWYFPKKNRMWFLNFR